MKKAIKILPLFLALSLLITFLDSCKKEDSNEEDQPQTLEGYVLTKHMINTQQPCFVNIMFQVTDREGKGIANLVTDDFQVSEEGAAVSPTESAMTIKKKEALPYRIKTVLMLDNSASVGSNLEEIKTAATTLVNNIVKQQEVAIYVFSENAILLQDFTRDINALVNAIESMSLGYATTDLYGSVITGVSRWEDYYSDTEIDEGFMMVITDGSDTQGSSTLLAAKNAIGDKKVYTVGLGNEQDPDALNQLGTAGYFPLEDYSELEEKFTEIQNEIINYANSFYWLYYMSPKRGGYDHQLELHLKDNPNTGVDSYIQDKFNSTFFYSLESGVYINNYYVDSTLNLDEGKSFNLWATSFFQSNIPDYSWTSSEPGNVSIEVDAGDNSGATITAIGAAGTSSTITVNDEENSLSTHIIVNVK
jgi:hypothetical protein